MTEVGDFGYIMFITWNTENNRNKKQSIDVLEKWGTYVRHTMKWKGFLVSIFRSDNRIMIQTMMSYPLDTKEGELYILPNTLTELLQTCQWKWEVSSNTLLHLMCVHALMVLAWLCLNLAFALIPKLTHHLLLHICVTGWSHSLLWKINTKCLLKNDLWGWGGGWGGPTCPKEDRSMDYLIFFNSVQRLKSVTFKLD